MKGKRKEKKSGRERKEIYKESKMKENLCKRNSICRKVFKK